MFAYLLKNNNNKYTHWYIVLVLIFFNPPLLLQAAERFSFNLPAMNTTEALEKIADISTYSLIYPFDSSITVISKPLLGRFTLVEALKKVLLDSHLKAVVTDKRVIVVSSKSLTKHKTEQLNYPATDKKLPAAPAKSNQINDLQTKINSPKIKTERIQVIGSRRTNRSPNDALAPLDIITKKDLYTRGNNDIISTLSNFIPSYNVSQEAISDAGTMVRPANLRGLPTDSILVLVNGKRRHRSGVIYEYISGLNVGAHGVDLEPIPSIALSSVEVLRDGAAAQYGSDAIAGIINFRLENNPEVNRIELRTGQFYQGDGAKAELAGIIGSAIGDGGTANFSFELSDSQATSRGIQDPAVQDLIDNGINKQAIQDPVVIWGAPEITNNIKLFGNIEFDIAQTNQYQQLYFFGNWAQRKVDGSFFYRNPNTRAGIFTDPSSGTRLFYDMTENSTGNCPTPTIPGSTDDRQALRLVATNPHCFAFNEWFSGGFTPRFGGRVTDNSLTGGVKGGLIYNKSELTYDFSLVAGSNRVDYTLSNSVNASLGENSPTNFELGAQIQTERVFNADFIYPLHINFESELNIAFGYQHHFEQFEIIAGEKAAYEIGPFSNNGESIGSNGFPGFSPETANINKRSSNAVYLDMETEVTENFAMSLAMRYEDIGKIGTSFDSKLSARLQVTDNLALRSTLSTGFRAPTVGQSTLQRISTSNTVVDDVVLQQTSQLVSALSPIAKSRSGGGLEAEKASSFGFGLLSDIGPMNITFDYFYLAVKDRLSLFSSEILPDDALLLFPSGVNPNVTNIQYYANDFNSITQGADIVASLPFAFFGGNNQLSFAFNYTDTQLEVTNPKSPIATFNAKKERQQGVPKTRGVLTYLHSQGRLNATARINYYGYFYNAQFNDVSLLEKVDAMFVTDLEFSYQVTNNLVIAVGAKNIFDVYPNEYSQGRTAGFQGAIYPLNTPNGFNGGHYYLSIGLDF